MIATTTSFGRGQVSPDDVRADQGRLLGDAVGEVERPLHGQVGRGGKADRQRVGRAAHRVDVGQVGRGGLAADVAGRGPLAAEVPALHEQVGRDDDVALRGAEHGGVVTGADVHVGPLGEPTRQHRDQAELPDVGERGTGREGLLRGSWRHLTRSEHGFVQGRRVPPRLVVG